MPISEYAEFVLEVTFGPDEVGQMIWNSQRHGDPTDNNLSRFVLLYNFDRNERELGRRPWWSARVLEQRTGKVVASFKFRADGIGTRVK